MSNCQGISGQIGCYINTVLGVLRDSVSASAEESAVGCNGAVESLINGGPAPVERDLTRAEWRATEIAELQREINEGETFFNNVGGFQVGISHESNRRHIELAQNYITMADMTGDRHNFELAENHLLTALRNGDPSRPNYVRDLPDIELELASLYLRMNNLTQADRYVDLALDHREGSEMIRHRALFFRGEIRQRQDRTAEAKELFQQVRLWSSSEAARGSFAHYWNQESEIGLHFLQAQSTLELARLITAEARNPDISSEERANKFEEAYNLLCEVLSIDETRVDDEEEGFIFIGYEALILSVEICIEQAATQTEANATLQRLPWESIFNASHLMVALRLERPGHNEDVNISQVFTGLWNIPSIPQYLLARLAVIRGIYENQLPGEQELLIAPATTSATPEADAAIDAAPLAADARCPLVMPHEGQTLNGAFFAHQITATSVSEYERMIGIQDEGLDIGLIFRGFIDGLTFPADAAQVMQERGGVLFIKIEPWAWRGVDDQTFPLQEIIDGNFDNILLNFAAGAAMYGGPVMVSFGHEMNGTWYPWHTSLADAHLYREAFRHMVEVVSSVACNITWVWNPTIDFAMREYFPGPSYVDWIAIDGYDLELAGRARRNFANLFEAAIREAHRLDPDAPIMIGEFGSAIFDNDSRPQEAFIRSSLEYMAQSHQPGNIPISAFVYFNYHAERETGVMSWELAPSSQAVFQSELDNLGPVYNRNPLITYRSPINFEHIDLAAEEAHISGAAGTTAGTLLIATIREMYRAFGRAELNEENGNYTCRVNLSQEEGEDAAGFQVSLVDSVEAREMRSLKFNINVTNMSENGRIVLRLYTPDNDDDENPSLRAEYTTANLPSDGEAAIDLTSLVGTVGRIHFVYYSETGGEAGFTINNLRLEQNRVVSSADGPAITLSAIDTARIAAAQGTARRELQDHVSEIEASGNPGQIAEAQLELWSFAHYTPEPLNIDVAATIARLPENQQSLWRAQIAMMLANETENNESQEVLAAILGDGSWRAQVNPQERQLAALTLIQTRLLRNEDRLSLFRGQNLFAQAQILQALGREGANERITQAREAVAPLLGTRPENYVHFRIWDQADKRQQHMARARFLMAEILMAEGNSSRNLQSAQDFLVQARETFGQEIEGFAIQLRLAENLFRQGEINNNSAERVRFMAEARDLLNDIISRASSARQSSTWLTSLAANAEGMLPSVYLGLIESTSWQGGEENLNRAQTMLINIPGNVISAIRRDPMQNAKYLIIRAEIQMRREEVNALMLESAMRSAVLATNNNDLIIRYVRGQIEAAFHFTDRAAAIEHLNGILPAIDSSIEGETQTLAQALVEVALGNFERYRGDFASAQTHYTRALAFYPDVVQNISDQRYEVKELALQANLGLGEIHRYAEGFRNFTTSRRYYQAAEVIAREGSGDRLTRAQIAFALGELDRQETHYETSIQQYNTVISIYEHRPDQDTPLGAEENAMLAQTNLGLLAIYTQAQGHQNAAEARTRRTAAQALIRSLPASERRQDLEAQLARLGQ